MAKSSFAYRVKLKMASFRKLRGGKATTETDQNASEQLLDVGCFTRFAVRDGNFQGSLHEPCCSR